MCTSLLVFVQRLPFFSYIWYRILLSSQKLPAQVFHYKQIGEPRISDGEYTWLWNCPGVQTEPFSSLVRSRPAFHASDGRSTGKCVHVSLYLMSHLNSTYVEISEVCVACTLKQEVHHEFLPVLLIQYFFFHACFKRYKRSAVGFHGVCGILSQNRASQECLHYTSLGWSGHVRAAAAHVLFNPHSLHSGHITPPLLPSSHPWDPVIIKTNLDRIQSSCASATLWLTKLGSQQEYV